MGGGGSANLSEDCRLTYLSPLCFIIAAYC